VARWREHRAEMAATADVERLLLDTACAGARELQHVAQRVRDEQREFDVRWAAWEKRAKAQVRALELCLPAAAATRTCGVGGSS
jgi:hypothetical protein